MGSLRSSGNRVPFSRDVHRLGAARFQSAILLWQILSDKLALMPERRPSALTVSSSAGTIAIGRDVRFRFAATAQIETGLAANAGAPRVLFEMLSWCRTSDECFAPDFARRLRAAKFTAVRMAREPNSWIAEGRYSTSAASDIHLRN
jgi:hypothetical protein